MNTHSLASEVLPTDQGIGRYRGGRPYSDDTKYDMTLVRRYNDGDNDAFTEIVNRYYPIVFTLALNKTSCRADAEDLTSIIFIRISKGLKSFRGDSSLRTWITSVAIRAASNFYWYLQCRGSGRIVSLDCPFGPETRLTVGDMLPSPDDDHVSQLELAELTKRIDIAMRRLSRAHQDILSLLLVQHLGYREIANKLGICIGTVKTRICRARKKLGRELDSLPE